MRLVPDVFAAFTTTRVAETANIVSGLSVGRSVRVADARASIARSEKGVDDRSGLVAASVPRGSGVGVDRV